MLYAWWRVNAHLFALISSSPTHSVCHSFSKRCHESPSPNTSLFLVYFYLNKKQNGARADKEDFISKPEGELRNH